MARRDSTGGDVWSFEQRLRRAAGQASVECTNGELASLLQNISKRRRARSLRLDLPSGDRSGADAEAGSSGAPAGTNTDVQAAPSANGGSAGGPAGTVLYSEAVGGRVRIMRIARPADFSFRAGQYVKVGLPGDSRRNDYSIASPPHVPYLELCIERIEAGRLSPRLAVLRVGERVALSDRAKGSFVLDDEADLHVMVATTTGIAPLRSILLDGLRRTNGRFVVLHGASYADELPYREELERLAASNPERVTYVATVSRATEDRNRGWAAGSGRSGRVDALAAELLALGDLRSRSPRVYACGNSGMIRSVEETFAEAGIPVTTEAFD